MEIISLNTPSNALPPLGTQARLVLDLLSDGEPHPKTELITLLGDDPRSALQSLTGRTYGFWLIHNISDRNAVYQLDERHLSGCRQLDEDARVIAHKRLAERSKGQCQSEIKRLPKALREHAVVSEQYQQRFNFDNSDQSTQVKDKPTPAS